MVEKIRNFALRENPSFAKVLAKIFFSSGVHLEPPWNIFGMQANFLHLAKVTQC